MTVPFLMLSQNAELAFALAFALYAKRLTVCVSRWWAGRDSLREQKKLEARKILVSRDESHQSATRGVRPLYYLNLSTSW